MHCSQRAEERNCTALTDKAIRCIERLVSPKLRRFRCLEIQPYDMAYDPHGARHR